jgi:putative transposase
MAPLPLDEGGAQGVLLSILYLLLRSLLRLLARRDEQARELEIFVLRHQLQVLRRQIARPSFTRADRLLLAAASRPLPRPAWSWFLVTPQTLLRWHRELVARKWRRYSNKPRHGRPPIDRELEDLIVRLARDNARWGYKRIQGELKKLGIEVSAATISRVLARNGLGPAPRRGETTWRQFLTQQATSILSCDFFTVETLFLSRIYVLFFIELATRRVHLGGCTPNPNGPWMIQQARNLGICLEDRLAPVRFVIHDRDSKFTAAFDDVFAVQGMEVIHTPYRAPKANAVAERWVRTVRQECLDWLLIVSRRHLQRVLRIYVEHYNQQRPHRSLGLQVPTSPGSDPPRSYARAPLNVRRQDRLGGLIHEYELAA